MNTAYLGLGSNLGDRTANIEQTMTLIHAHANMEVVAVSALYTFPALTRGNAPQPDYLNGALEIRTGLTPLELLDALQGIESKLGRPSDHGSWEPRTIDLDILIYDTEIVTHDRLIIPHPEMAKRTFVLQPLCDIAPSLKHPVAHRTMRELYDALTRSPCSEYS